MVGSSLLSVIPEVHVILSKSQRGPNSLVTCRTDEKGKHFVSIFDNERDTEWRITKSHCDHSAAASRLTPWLQSEDLNTCILLGVAENLPILLSSDQVEFVDSVSSAFIVPKEGRSVCASAWAICDEAVDDLLTSGRRTCSVEDGSDEIIPVTISVKLNSLVDYQKFIRRVQTSCSTDAHAILCIRFAVFEATGSVHFVHFVLTRLNRNLIENLKVIPDIRSDKKRGSKKVYHLSLSQKYLVPLLAGNSKLFIVVPLQVGVTPFYPTLLDICERICLVTLSCAQEEEARMDDFEVVERVDLLISRIASSQHVLKVAIPPANVPDSNEEEFITAELCRLDLALDGPADSSLQNSLEAELCELKGKNLLLRSEIDRLKLGSVSQEKPYTVHLVNEVKSLRANLLQVETEKRKYLTSRRLVDSLVEKTNKLKAEVDVKTAKAKELEATNKNLKNELTLMRNECEKLLADNSSLVVELQQPAPDPSLQFRSLYQEFLFPFGKTKQLESGMIRLFETLQKIERSVAINAPSATVDVRRALQGLDDLRGLVNNLLSASEKLQISAGCILIGGHENVPKEHYAATESGSSWRTS